MKHIDRIAKRYLAPCPVCGKLPKLTRDYVFEEMTNKVCIIAKCKPIFGKPHIRIQVVGDNENNAINYCITSYNKAARNEH